MIQKILVAMAKLVLLTIFLMPLSVSAYLGPGAGISAIGSAIAIVVAIIVAIFGFLWYPMKRMLRNKKKAEQPNTTESVINKKVEEPKDQVEK